LTRRFAAAAAAAAVAMPRPQKPKQKAATDAACFKILRTRNTKARNNLRKEANNSRTMAKNNLRKERAKRKVSTLLMVCVLRLINSH
jgi:hypothetical protein